MRIPGRNSVAAFAVLLCAMDLSAQHQTFQMYGPAQGLTNPTIIALSQDHQGFLWVSTEGGLFRYDGDRFQQFGLDPASKLNSLAMHSSADGQFWVASTAGLFRWTGDRFQSVPGFQGMELEYAQTLASDASNLYVATPAGLRSMPLRGGPPRTISSEPASTVMVGADGAIWFSCGPRICSIQSGRKSQWGTEQGVAGALWRSIAEDKAGRLWIRSYDQILVHQPGDSAFHPVRDLPELNSTRGSLLVANRLGQILIPYNGGLTLCDGRNCRDSSPAIGNRHPEVLAAAEDREGSLWLGFSGYGLARALGRDEWQSFDELEGLANTAIWRIVRDRDGGLWVGTNRGLFHGTEQNGRWRFRQSDAVGDLTVYGLAADPDGSIWIGTFQTGANGLVRYNPRTGSKTVFPPSQPIPNFSISDIVRDAAGSIWVATPRAVLRLTPGASQLVQVPLPFESGFVFQVLPSAGGLLAGTQNGLFIEQGGIRRILTVKDGLKDNAVNSIVLGPYGEIWISYFSPPGITRVEIQGSQFHLKHLSLQDGLPSNTVYAQFFDAGGRHWVATDSGVGVLSKGRWITYDTSNGLIWNDCNVHAYLAEGDGTVWIGTSAGLARYHQVAQPKSVVPSTLITSVLRNDAPSSNREFDSSTYAVALRFTVLSYQNPAPTFRYRLGSASDSWVRTQSHEVRFAELPAGSYRFEVQGEFEPGAWSKSAILQFRIRPRWFLWWPVQAGLFLALVGLAWLWWHHREVRQQRVRAELEAAVAERTRDLAAATARAERASRFKSEFLANMSHEMRTPLNGVIGVTQLALEANRQPEVAKHLEIAKVSAKALLSVINDVLDFSKIESGILEIHPVVFALRPCVAEICSMFRPDALGKGLALEHHVAESAPEWVLADDSRLRQVLVNLIGNALKFTQLGAVSVDVAWAADRLSFAVIDTGIGIPANKLETIFDAFRQADSSTSRRFGGTGLGLTISKKLVDAMAGSLTVESEPGQGSTFSFTINAPEAKAPAAPQPAANPGPTRPMKILVAEDNGVNQYLIRNLLAKRGHGVTLVENGIEALAALEQSAFDLVLMDIQMPEMDGVEAVRRIRNAEQPSKFRIPVVALTAKAMTSDREEMLAVGMDDYLEKPIQIERLDAVLARFSRSGP